MKNVNRILIYKSDGSEIIDVSDHVQSLSLEKGSVEETGDIYADNPVQGVNITLKNTNNKQFSPHFEKGKMVFNHNYNLTLNGGNEYNLPYNYIEQVVSLTDGYIAQMLNGKIYIDCFEGYNLTGTIKLGITYIDTTVNNPLNHLTGNVFSPLIAIGNRVSWYRDTFDNSYEGYQMQGNGTNQLTITNTKTPLDVTLQGAYIGAKNYYNWLSENYFDILQDNYFQTAVGVPSEELNDISFNKVGNDITITFDRVIESTEYVLFIVYYEDIQNSFLKFDGYISEDPSSDIETCTFVCDDRTFDLKKAKLINSDDLRTYSSIKKTDNTYETTEELLQLLFSNNVATSSNLNYTQYFTLNEVIGLYDGQNFKKATITALSSGSITVSPAEVTNPVTVFSGEYSAHRIYDPGIPLPTYIQNCLNDKGLPYTLYNNNSEAFAVLPKQTDMQQVDLHNYFQDLIIKTGNLLNFENVNGNFEYVLKSIPMTFATPKYVITEDYILQGTNYGLRGKDVRTSWYLKYQALVDGKYETRLLVKDDFILSPNTLTIGVERNIINIDEVFVVGDIIRINNQYYKIAQGLTSSKYRLNKSVIKEDSYKLYKSGEFTNGYGLKIAQYELDNTSAIDTEEEAEDFTDRLLYQTKEPYAVYQIKLNADDYELNNFDTIEVTSPRLSLYNEKCFVQSVNESYSSGSNILTITICKKQIIGKYKIKEMIAERGLNQIVTANKQSTSEIFPPPQNLKALEPAIDDLQNYVVYSAVSWDSMIGRSVIQWELQYKVSTEDWSKAETITLNETSLKLVLKEQKLYDIRVRGVGKEQVKGEWSYTQCNCSTYIVDPTIRDRTWYVDLRKYDSPDSFLEYFDKLNYSKDELNSLIDNVEITVVNNQFNLFGLEDFSKFGERWGDYTTGVTGKLPFERYKNLFIKGSPNGEVSLYALDTGFGFKVPPIKSVVGEKGVTVFRSSFFKSFFGNVLTGIFLDTDTTSQEQYLKDFTIKINTEETTGLDNPTRLDLIKGLRFKNIYYDNVRIISNVNLTNVNIVAINDGKKVNNCIVDNVYNSYYDCIDMLNNKSINNKSTKYTLCYSPNGALADSTANGGFNL